MTDKKITALTALTAAVGTDIVPIVDDPGGSPATKKITVANLIGGAIAAKGDIYAGTGVSAATALTVGSNAQKLVANSAATNGVSWIDDDVAIEIIMGGGLISTGVQCYIEMPFAMTIEAVRLVSSVSGSIVVDIWKDTYANFPPTDADSITSSTPPTLTTATKAEDTDLTSWTTALAKGDWLVFNVDSVTSCVLVTLSLSGKRAAVA
jgi:hypothetical protein